MEFLEFRNKIKEAILDKYCDEFITVIIDDKSYELRNIKITGRNVILLIQDKFPNYKIPAGVFINIQGLDNYNLKAEFIDNKEKIGIDNLSVKAFTDKFLDTNHVVIKINKEK